ncbi:GIY-YIG nuclease family protein [Flavobacterium faecale]|uniref:GIY-YIG nuclease family protein n=1 Tax=Flavobacterium faecale TaxID=1355330 RepID=UPI003AAC6BD2
MEEFVVYILYSEKFDKNYTGFTSNLIERFKSHNELETKGHTLKFRPWKVIHVEFFNSKSEAMKREKYLKTGVGREFIKNLIQNAL